MRAKNTGASIPKGQATEFIENGDRVRREAAVRRRLPFKCQVVPQNERHKNCAKLSISKSISFTLHREMPMEGDLAPGTLLRASWVWMEA